MKSGSYTLLPSGKHDEITKTAAIGTILEFLYSKFPEFKHIYPVNMNEKRLGYVEKSYGSQSEYYPWYEEELENARWASEVLKKQFKENNEKP